MPISKFPTPLLKLLQNQALYVGPIRDNRLHQHYAVQACFSLEQPFFIRSNVEEVFVPAYVAFIPSQTFHQVQSEENPVFLLFIEPDSQLYQQLAIQYPTTGITVNNNPLNNDHVEQFLQLVPKAKDEKDICELINLLLTSKPVPPMASECSKDPRIQQAQNLLLEQPHNYGSVQELSRKVGLSESRLRHLFKEQVGVPIKRYRLWSKLKRATVLLAQGTDLLQACHQSGFSDSAHLSKSYREMFGITPSELWKNIKPSIEVVDGAMMPSDPTDAT